MKKSRKISVFVTLAVSLIFLSCSNPSSSGNGSDSNNGGGSAPTSTDNPGNTTTNPDNPSGTGDTPDNPDNTPTNPDTPSGGSDTSDNPNGGGTTNPIAPIYEWIVTKLEYTYEAHQNNYDLEYSSISNYSYPTYNSKSDHSCISMETTNQNQTLNDNNTQTETQSKTIYTYSLSNNIGTYNSSTYNNVNGNWIKVSELILETDQESGFNKSQISRTYNNNIVVSETTYVYSITLLSNDGETKTYKQIQTNQTPTSYSVREIKNGICQKQKTYNMNDVLQNEMIYFKSNNVAFNERLPDYYLYTLKAYSNGNLALEYNQEITILTFNDSKIVFEISLSTNTAENFSKYKYTYEKMQVPIANAKN